MLATPAAVVVLQCATGWGPSVLGTGLADDEAAERHAEFDASSASACTLKCSSSYRVIAGG